MSRTLSDLLHAPELPLRARLRQLERASGLPSSDVRLTAEVLQSSQRKLKALGLDANDTTPQELYAALNQRYIEDNRLLLHALAQDKRLHGDAHEVMSVVAQALRHLPLPEQCLAIKPAVLKRLLKKTVPKATMKALGYRSIDSMLKHEPLAAVQTAAELLETTIWQRAYGKALAQLQPTDFENRPLAIVYADHVKWLKLARSAAFRRRHHIVAVPLSGSVLLLPFGQEAPRAASLSSLVVAVTAINHVAASSAYLKLHQMRADFGQAATQLKNGQSAPLLDLLGEPVSWQLIQRYYHRFKDIYRAELFEPHLQPTDFAWLGADVALTYLAPALGFWRGSSALGYGAGEHVVSFNVHDAALNVTNRLPYGERVLAQFRRSLWQEIQLSYLQPSQVEAALLGHMQPAYALARVEK